MHPSIHKTPQRTLDRLKTFCLPLMISYLIITNYTNIQHVQVNNKLKPSRHSNGTNSHSLLTTRVNISHTN